MLHTRKIRRWVPLNLNKSNYYSISQVHYDAYILHVILVWYDDAHILQEISPIFAFISSLHSTEFS